MEKYLTGVQPKGQLASSLPYFQRSTSGRNSGWIAFWPTNIRALMRY